MLYSKYNAVLYILGCTLDVKINFPTIIGIAHAGPGGGAVVTVVT